MKAKWFPFVFGIVVLAVIVAGGLTLFFLKHHKPQLPPVTAGNDPTLNDWKAPDYHADPALTAADREQMDYGKDLVAHTAAYFGPKGTVARMTNGMNCQNCHLDAGTRPWANNFALSALKYPRISTRSGNVQTLFDRINGCFQRSMNGEKLDTASREMRAMVAYIQYLGKGITMGQSPQGAGLPKIEPLNRAADPKKGQGVFITLCQRCHGNNGQGKKNETGTEYIYPPLWGPDSFNDGAGLYRLSGFASFIKSNMPYDITSHWSPALTQEQAWDVAAFVNSQPRPHKDQRTDYPNLEQKPFDAPFGPYADTFPEKQHKYGPFKPIIEARAGGTKK